MDFLQILVLAAVQGVTEFLPISSSAHLILVPVFTGWPDQGLGMDVAMHVGTLAAVILYFRHDCRRLVAGAWDVLTGRRTAEAALTLQIALATLPVLAAGLLLYDTIADDWRDPVLIASTTSSFAVLLWLADRRANRAERLISGLSWRDALIIGLAQALALVPGVSRSGITMTAALFLGLKRPEAARFSLLLSIPTTAAAGVLSGIELMRGGDGVLLSDAAIGGLLAFGFAFMAIWGLMSWLRQASFTPFVLYRLALSAVLAGLLAFGVLPA